MNVPFFAGYASNTSFNTLIIDECMCHYAVLLIKHDSGPCLSKQQFKSTIISVITQGGCTVLDSHDNDLLTKLLK